MLSLLGIMRESPLFVMDVIGGSALFIAILVLVFLSFHYHENDQKLLSSAHILAIAFIGVMIAVGSAVVAATSSKK